MLVFCETSEVLNMLSKYKDNNSTGILFLSSHLEFLSERLSHIFPFHSYAALNVETWSNEAS